MRYDVRWTPSLSSVRSCAYNSRITFDAYQLTRQIDVDFQLGSPVVLSIYIEWFLKGNDYTKLSYESILALYNVGQFHKSFSRVVSSAVGYIFENDTLLWLNYDSLGHKLSLRHLHGVFRLRIRRVTFHF